MAKVPTIPRKGPMEAEDALRIQKSSAYMEAHVDGRDLTATLYQDLIIDSDDKEHVESGKTRKDRIRNLLGILRQRGPRAYSGLLMALRTNGYEEIANVIEEKEKIYSKPKNNDMHRVFGRLKDQVAGHNIVIHKHGKAIGQHRVDIDELKDRVHNHVPNGEVVKIKNKYEKMLKEKEDEMQKIRRKIEEKERALQQLRNDFTEERSRLNSELDRLKKRLEESTEQYLKEKEELIKMMEAQKEELNTHREEVKEVKGEVDDMKKMFLDAVKRFDAQTAIKPGKPNKKSEARPPWKMR
ncbi:unnamed protein product [Lymnaea stagnalis]|uniref:CARD domain-containing protein n=1 Tax=Lymnaea stagnalis TaxID=6523 RepID=A0AAV2IES7_LYMST